MKSKLLLPLALCSVAALLASGCATQPTHNGKITTILGGLVVVQTGDYTAPDPIASHLEGTKLFGGTPSGTSISTFYGATKYTDY